MGYAINKDGTGWRMVDSKKDCLENEVFSESPQKPYELSPTQLEIYQLEAQVTPRRIREALVSGDYSFISEIEQKIESLRQNL